MTREDTHRLIKFDEYTACTPDALVAMTTEARLFQEGDRRVNVAPLETKCPPVLHRFIKLFRCKTPQELKKVMPDYYYQVMFQMICCESLKGFFAVYHPKFPVKMRVIQFNKIDMRDEFKKFANTLAFAVKEVQNIEAMFAAEIKLLEKEVA